MAGLRRNSWSLLSSPFLERPQPLVEPLMLAHHRTHLVEHVGIPLVAARPISVEPQNDRRQDSHLIVQRTHLVPQPRYLSRQEFEGDRLIGHGKTSPCLSHRDANSR